MDEGEDGEDSEAKDNDGDSHEVDRVAVSGQFGGHQLVGSLH